MCGNRVLEPRARLCDPRALVSLARCCRGVSSTPASRPLRRATKTSRFRRSCRRSRRRSRRHERQRWIDLLSPNADRDAATEFFDSMVPQGVTRAVVRERDREPLDRRAARRGLSAHRRRLHRNRRARAHPHVAPRHPAAARLDRAPAVAHRRRGEAVVDRRPASPRACTRRSSSPHATSCIQSVDFELRLPAATSSSPKPREGVTRWCWSATARCRSRPGRRKSAGRCGSSPAPTRSRRRSPPSSCGSTRSSSTSSCKRQSPRRRRSITRALRRAQTIFDEEVGKSFQPRPARPQPRQLVAAAASRRLPRRSPHAPLRHADLRALDWRSRGRHALSSRPRSATSRPTRRAMKLSSRGRFFNEDDLVEYDVLDYTSTRRSHRSASGSTAARACGFASRPTRWRH